MPRKTNPRLASAREKILVVDGDPDIVRFIDVNLRSAGYETAMANDGTEALAVARRERPDLLLIEVALPVRSGFEVAAELRRHPTTANIHIIMLTHRALTTDKVTGLMSGADDYIVKPFDPIELLARVKGTLQRGRYLRELSPLTGLPGNTRLRLEIQDRLKNHRPFAALYIDIDHFKPFNDYFGLARGDDVIQFVARMIADESDALTAGEAFCGHFGGDDFIALVPPTLGVSLAQALASRFDEASRELYDAEDASRGFIEAPDRNGVPAKYPLLTISIGIASTEQRRFVDDEELLAVLGRMKQLAKRKTGSSFAVARATRVD